MGKRNGRKWKLPVEEKGMCGMENTGKKGVESDGLKKKTDPSKDGPVGVFWGKFGDFTGVCGGADGDVHYPSHGTCASGR